MNIRTVVIPAAGLGTRFLPITKVIPKELLPLLNKPALQYVIEEGVASDITEFCIIVSESKQAIKEYFSPDTALHKHLKKTNKLHFTQELDALINTISCSYITQPTMKGLGDAVLMAEQKIPKGDYFALVLPDEMLFHPSYPGIKQLMDIAQQHNAVVIGVMEVPPQEISSYGCIKIKETIQDGLVRVDDIIEKPAPQQAFSNLAISGRYILPHAIFDALKQCTPAANGELQLTDALVQLVKEEHNVLAYTIKGDRFDLGRPHGWLAANKYIEHTISTQ